MQGGGGGFWIQCLQSLTLCCQLHVRLLVTVYWHHAYKKDIEVQNADSCSSTNSCSSAIPQDSRPCVKVREGISGQYRGFLDTVTQPQFSLLMSRILPNYGKYSCAYPTSDAVSGITILSRNPIPYLMLLLKISSNTGCNGCKITK